MVGNRNMPEVDDSTVVVVAASVDVVVGFVVTGFLVGPAKSING